MFDTKNIKPLIYIVFKKTFFLIFILLFSLVSPSVFSKDIFFVCNSDREEYFFQNRMFSLFDEFQLKINIRKKLIDVNFNHLWEFKDSETDYENFKIIDLNDVFKITNFTKDNGYVYFDVSVYPYGFNEILKDNNLQDKSWDYSDIEKRKIYEWLKYFDEIKEGSFSDKNNYLDIIRFKFDRQFHKIYVEKNYKNHFSTTKKPFATWINYLLTLEGEEDHTNAFLNCKEKNKI